MYFPCYTYIVTVEYKLFVLIKIKPMKPNQNVINCRKKKLPQSKYTAMC